MPVSPYTGTAEIIPFPIRARSRGPSLDALNPIADTTTKKIFDASSSGSWYHEAAVEDALRGPKS